MADTKAQTKVLFVGKERICRQIAYVLDIKDYAFTEKLTAENFNQYRDYQIYVCEFKHKSGRYVKRKVLTSTTNIEYLDDICRTIDEENDTNKRSHNETTAHEPGGMKHKSSHKKDHKGDLLYLRQMKPSKLLLFVLHAPVKKNIQCVELENKLRVYKRGDVRGCSSAMVPFGNLLQDGELDEIYNSTYARIVKLSSLNRSYCLCNFNRWCKGYCAGKNPLPTEKWETTTLPKSMILDYELSCNLCCKSCRNQPYVLTDVMRQNAETITTKLLRSGWLEQVPKLNMSGSGEVFYSPYYRQLLLTDLQRKDIRLISNGVLFNEDNWKLLAGKYEKIIASISVDAATEETYQKIRGADFNHLKKNLTMIGNLRRQGRIRMYVLNFVVQRDNFREMADFVRLGRTLGADSINFQRFCNLGNLTPREFRDNCLIINEKYLNYELWCVLQDPIFHDPIVDLQGLQRYIDASESRYRKRYERERRKRSV